ncbi:hypothetical protein BT67DRAFT_353453, partial [Trichocladium antarcticum]
MANSIVWTAEEAKYLKAIFRWQGSADDGTRARLAEDASTKRRKEQQGKPAGELRVLVIGARATGKTAILARLGQGTAPSKDQPRDRHHPRSCRHPITLTTNSEPQTYMIDAREFPSPDLPSNPLLAHALDITEAAVLVYSVHDEPSFRLAQSLAEFIHEHFTPPSPTATST